MLGLLATLIACVASVLYAIPIMLLWNALMPVIFGLKEISFIQALMMGLLSSILFKNSPTSSTKK